MTAVKAAAIHTAADEWSGLTPGQVSLLKQLYRDAPDETLKLFVYRAKSAGLDPLSQQIHLLKREWIDKKTNQPQVNWTTLVGIDGLRAIADRTGAYAPGKAADIEEINGKIISAIAYVNKRVGSEWFEYSARAYFAEYSANTLVWTKMPRNQIAKCAEALAIRKGFPLETGGLYSDAEISPDEPPAPDALTTARPTATPKPDTVTAKPANVATMPSAATVKPATSETQAPAPPQAPAAAVPTPMAEAAGMAAYTIMGYQTMHTPQGVRYNEYALIDENGAAIVAFVNPKDPGAAAMEQANRGDKVTGTIMPNPKSKDPAARKLFIPGSKLN